MKMNGKPWMNAAVAALALVLAMSAGKAWAGGGLLLAASYDVGFATDMAVVDHRPDLDRDPGPMSGAAGISAFGAAGTQVLSSDELDRQRGVGVDGLPMVQTGGELGDLAVILWDEFLGSQLGQAGGDAGGGSSVTVNGQAH